MALDVARAVSREQALEPLQRHLRRLLDDSDLPGDARDLFDELLVRVVATMADVAERRQDEQVRQAGGALYHLCTAIFMAWEASRQAPDQRRLALAFLVARHKLLPRDPLHLEVGPTRPNCWPGWSARCR